ELLADGVGVFTYFSNAEDVFVGFGRKPQNEIELHAVEATREHTLRRLHELLFGDVLVDHVTHALSARFRRKSEPRRAHLAHVVEQVFRQAISSEAGYTEAHSFRGGFFNQTLNER